MKKNRLKRSDVQFAFFIIAVLVTVNNSLIEVGKGISWLSSGYIHYVCPVCGVTTIYQFFASSADWITKISNPVFWVIAASIILAVTAGPIFCGWICPFGGFQDFVAGFGKKIFKKRYNNFINKKLDKALRWLRYVSLVVVIYMVAKSTVTFIESINPYHALLNLFVGEFAVIGLISLGVVIIASLFIHRPWCKYLCPYGAFLGIFNIFKVKAVVRNESTCINCKKCDKACPMNIEVSQNEVVRDQQCISCLECTSNNACPVDSTVRIKGTKGIKETINVNAKNIIVFVLAVAALVVFTYSAVTSSLSGQSSDVDLSGITVQLDGKYTSGTYTGVGTGYNSGLTVEVTIDNNQITDIEITNHNETLGYYEPAFEAVPSSILSEQSTDVDTVSGATRSSEGIIEAVNDALSQAQISSGTSNSVTEEQQDTTDNSNQTSDTSDTESNAAQGSDGQQTQNQNQNQGQSQDDSQSQENDTADVIAVGGYTDGTYTSSAQGYGGLVTVEVTVEGGYIVNIDIADNDETENFFERAIAVVDNIIGTGTTEVDTVTNATVSSQAIIDAVDMALADAK